MIEALVQNNAKMQLQTLTLNCKLFHQSILVCLSCHLVCFSFCLISFIALLFASLCVSLFVPFVVPLFVPLRVSLSVPLFASSLVSLFAPLLVPLFVPSGCSLLGFPCSFPVFFSVLFACLFFVDWWNSLQFSVRACSYILALFWTNSSIMNVSFDISSPSHTVKFFSHFWFLG